MFLNFNPRSHERSDVIIKFIRGFLEYFNPRSHERSDKKSVDDGDMMSISIHAPTRGATDITIKWCGIEVISIHAPTRGATAILHKKFVYFYTIPTINI